MFKRVVDVSAGYMVKFHRGTTINKCAEPRLAGIVAENKAQPTLNSLFKWRVISKESRRWEGHKTRFGNRSSFLIR
jgi:hypothetical protein